MKLLSNFANPGEAGFFQSLLAADGIESDLQDGILDLGGLHESRVYVGESDFDRAREILMRHQAVDSQTPKGTRSAPPHPAAGFPFLGIMGFVALVYAALATLVAAKGLIIAHGFLIGLLHLVGLFVIALLPGLLAGSSFALVCLLIRITWRRFR